MSNRLADPDQLPDKTSNGQSGGTTFGVPGGHLMLQFPLCRLGRGPANFKLAEEDYPATGQAGPGNDIHAGSPGLRIPGEVGHRFWNEVGH